MKKALIVIDVQNDYFPQGAFPLENASVACTNVLNAIEYARLQNWLIVGVQHVSAPDAPFFRPDSEGVRLHPHIAEALGDAPVIRKAQADSFYETCLEALLHDQGITDVYLTGMMTQHCITHTALSLQAREFSMHIIAEACAAPTDALHELALSGLAARCSIE
ncbi:isochorismatase family protein (plasmid) [Enterobacter hormaechei]|uniref:cysteine hydrolase family protein n=1 Tax=Enterobacter hormaechei TaxID=158836 RepID=UPI000A365D93|nr:isochorismatase family protein [Enterobacter hormaechei]MCE1525623.1 isochorismatase family protein [Enterobacter hormaechei]OUF18843.1 hypothetical protein AZ045_004406 [Enterobacter hormaechei]WLR86721.1 isochorismatase family protein [Enterobacter hormaechei]HCR0932787.1 isochorismatase family protein [Enterobacter hormaechei]HEM8052238.1 isochorismatase family protein [Enterobacter hormaechei]